MLFEKTIKRLIREVIKESNAAYDKEYPDRLEPHLPKVVPPIPDGPGIIFYYEGKKVKISADSLEPPITKTETSVTAKILEDGISFVATYDGYRVYIKDHLGYCTIGDIISPTTINPSYSFRAYQTGKDIPKKVLKSIITFIEEKEDA